MSPKAVALLVIVIVIIAAALVALALWWLSRQAGVRLSTYKRMQRERNLALRAIQDIESKTDVYRDLESVLATEIRTITRKLNTERMDLPK